MDRRDSVISFQRAGRALISRGNGSIRMMKRKLVPDTRKAHLKPRFPAVAKFDNSSIPETSAVAATFSSNLLSVLSLYQGSRLIAFKSTRGFNRHIKSFRHEQQFLRLMRRGPLCPLPDLGNGRERTIVDRTPDDVSYGLATA